LSALSKFRLYAPEFSKRTDAQVQEMIDEVSTDVHVPTFGLDADKASAHLAAHAFEKIERRRDSPGGWSPTGPVKSVTGAEVAMTFGEAKNETDGDADDDYRQTDHGKEFLKIRDRRAGVGMFLAC
jgi:hypothetical protein